MLKNYLIVAVRNIRRSASYTFINISGLALGLACALLIFSIVSYHLSFDNFHQNSARIYRFVTEQHRDQVSYARSVPPAFGKAFREDYTFAEKVARLCTADGQVITIGVGSGTKKFKEEVAFAEPEFFDIFNFELTSGKRDNLLATPGSVIITERIAKKYFGNNSPIGETILFNNKVSFTVAGVLKDIPDNTDLRTEIFLSYSNIKQYNEWYATEDAWGGITSDIQTFARLQPNVDPAAVESVLPAYVKKYRAESKNVHHYKLQPLKEMHFDSRYNGVISHNILWVLSIIGALLMFTACLNFINLATAQVVNRSREVGVRKVLGSARTQLFWQFTLETGVIVFLAALLAFGVCYSILPFVNELLNTRVALDLLTDVPLTAFSIALVLGVTFLSAFYPGLILSGFKPVLALKGKLTGTSGGSFNVRRVLITTQFAISQILLIGLIVILYQMRYVGNTDMGFDHEAIVMIPLGSKDLKMKTVREQFLQIPNVEKVTACFSAPASDMHWGTTMWYDNRSEAETFAVSFRGGDDHYVSTFGLELVAGRNLMPSDTAREFLVNETLVKKLNLTAAEEMIGRTVAINGGSWKGPVVGVIKDFHDQSFHSDISPVFMSTVNDNYNQYAVKINMNQASATLRALEKTWSSAYPEQIFEYQFLDEQTATFYHAEQTMTTLVQVFSFIALAIGSMGLYGLVSFMAVQKTKEIGIRKVLGGSVSGILWIFGKEFSKLVLIAFLIAAPIGWILMSQWLQNYVYHINMSVWILTIELVIITVIVLLTVGYQSLKAAHMNPVNSLRTE